MKLMSIYRNILMEYSPDGDTHYYHGTNEPHGFEKYGNITDGSYFASEYETAKNYGQYIYVVSIKSNLNIFDTQDVDDVKKLLDKFGYLIDTYYSEDEPEYKITKPEQLVNFSDTWGYIERTDGVLGWIERNGYDGVRLIEGGSEDNLLLFAPIKDKITIIDIHDTMHDGDEMPENW